MNPCLKKLPLPTIQYSVLAFFPNDKLRLTRQPPAQFGNLDDPHLKITNRILAKFQSFHSAWREIHYVL